jgi:hypothetical protein
VRHVDAAILLDLARHGREGLAERIVAWMNATGRTMIRHGEPIPDAETIPLIAAHSQQIEATIVPRLRRYGVLTGG